MSPLSVVPTVDFLILGSTDRPWRADHERRTLLYKYCVSHMAWSRARVLPPPDVKLTARQQALLTEPADPHTFVPSLFSDAPGAER